jgi:sulfoxide reductase heme-binding subunit YedZ
MTPVLATVGPSAYWYLSRGTGAVSLVLLTASVFLGILGSLRFASAPRWPRFTIDMLHRQVSLLAVALLALHIVTSVLDSFAPLKLTDAVIPFVSAYRPLWMGLGALSFDLIAALVVTSLLRRRLGYRAWRAIHWFAYASWPVAVLHGLGTGSDTKQWWMLALTAVCVAVVVMAVLTRLGRAGPGGSAVRPAAIALAIASPIGIALFTFAGPLQKGWARRAGTPGRLLGTAFPVATRQVAATQRRSPATGKIAGNGFSARLSGRMTQKAVPGGIVIDMSLLMDGSVPGRLRVRLAGAPLDGGGLSLTGSQVDLGAPALASVLEGQVVSLQGQQFLARVANRSGTVLDLRAALSIDSQTGRVSGTMQASPAGSGG